MSNYDYIITRKEVNNSKLINKITLNDYIFYFNKDIDDVFVSKNKEVLMFGDVFDSFLLLKTEEEIVSFLMDVKNKEESIEFINRLSGRFIIIQQFETESYVFSDAICSVPIIYNDNHKVITSNPNLLKELNVKKDIDNLKILKKGNSRFLPNDLTPYEGFKSMLPNHYFSLKDFRASRIKTQIMDITYEEVLDESIKIINNTISAISDKYDVFLPLTAGYDSRTILSFLNKDNLAINSYTFKHQHMDENNQDLTVPKTLAHKFEFFHEIFDQSNVPKKTEEKIKLDLGEYYDQHIMKNAYTLSKHLKKNQIFLNAEIIPLVKAKFGKKLPEKLGSWRYLNTKTYNYSSNSRKHLKDWHLDAKKYSLETGFSIYDLMFWEMRTCKWGTANLMNYDYFVKSINPFNNRYLIILWLSVNREERFNKSFHIELINKKWPELLSVEFNPKFKSKNIFENSMMYYMISWVHYYINKVKYIFK